MVAERGRSSNSLEQAGGIRYTQYVPTTTLDTLLDDFAAPNLIKIDVEGVESLVLTVATRILTDVRPAFYIEVASEQNAAITALFETHDYRLYDGDNVDGVQKAKYSYNTLAVPNESKMTNRGIIND